jgi:DNA-binding MarR family transcriptional regulator
MNKKTELSLDEYTVYRLLCELGGDTILSQRDLSRRLGNALGLINAYLKGCAAKGWIKVKELNGSRNLYLVTPKGVAERRRIACNQLKYMDELLQVFGDAYGQICKDLKNEGVVKVACCGIEPMTGLVVQMLTEAGIEVSLMMDNEKAGGTFQGRDVVSLAHALLSGNHRIVVSSIRRGEELRTALLELGASPTRVMLPEFCGGAQ